MIEDSVKPLLIGHRGAPGYRPEHTSSSYQLAFAQGVDAVEPDIVLSSDGVLVLRHENEISGTTNVSERSEFADRYTTKTIDGKVVEGWFTEDFTWAELQTLTCNERLPDLRPQNTKYNGLENILSLADLFKVIKEHENSAKKQISLVIELKHVNYYEKQGFDFIALLMQELKKHDWHDKPKQLTIESFELGALNKLRVAGVKAELVFLMESKGGPADELEKIGTEKRNYAWYRSEEGLKYLSDKVHGISLDKIDLFELDSSDAFIGISDIVIRAHKHGLKVFTWTLRPENKFLNPAFRLSGDNKLWGDWKREWQLILSTGLDGVFLDHPDMLAKVI
ncbi:MAG TPA: glycerophosphodiester phosphodiesterase family protein [Microbacteriaceae bacterium]|nr:glycerophosphodiester phosphodiesterase family protein [Microbacteriaceae bacterium]